MVWGVEAQASAANIQGGGRQGGHWVNALGGAVDRAMLYVKGGLAWAHERQGGLFSARA